MSLIYKPVIRMYNSLCVDETACINVGLYKSNLVFNKDLMLNMTLKKQLSLIPMQHLFLSLNLNEADSLPLLLYIPPKTSFSLDQIPFLLNV